MGTFMSNKSHASNLLKYNAVDDKASALNYNGKKRYDEFGTEIPEGFTVDSRTGKAKGVGAGSNRGNENSKRWIPNRTTNF